MVIRIVLIAFAVCICVSHTSTNAEEIKKRDIDKLESILADYRASLLAMSDHLVDCSGWKTEIRPNGNLLIDEVSFRYVGIFDRDRNQTRWICRNDALLREVDVPPEYAVNAEETELVFRGDTLEIWSNGMVWKPPGKDKVEEREQFFKNPRPTVVRIHPFVLIAGGWGTMGDAALKGRELHVSFPRTEELKSLTKKLGSIRATWVGAPGQDGQLEFTIEFDERFGWMPVAGESSFVLGEKREKLYAMEAAWEREGESWFPSEVAFVRYYGGEKNPSKLIDFRMTIDWKTSLTNVEDYFEEDEFGRPSWNTELTERLGPFNRMDPETAFLHDGLRKTP